MNLNNKINLFIKKSMIEPPPKMVDYIYNRAKAFLSKEIYYNVCVGSKNNDEIKALEQLLQQYKSAIYSDNFTCLINLDGWKYSNMETRSILNYYIEEYGMKDFINIKFDITNGSPNRGHYDFNINEIAIIFDDNRDILNINTIDKYKNKLGEIHTTICHELIHWSQFILSIIKSLNFSPTRKENGKLDKGNMFGFAPKKYRNKNYDVQGRNIHYYLNDEINEHSLRDIEFYTNLDTAMQHFKNVALNNKPVGKYDENSWKSWIKKYAYAFMGLDGSYGEYPFNSLKTLSEEKYKFACKKFWTEIQKLDL